MDPTYPKWSPQSLLQNRRTSLWLTALAAFCAYFCMFGFRKPFAASTYDDVTAFGIDLKSSLVLAQLLGYMTSKFIGIKVISEMPAHRRAWAIIGLIGLAELALIGFAVLPVPFKVLMLFLNGMPLGMIFGLVLAYLEGRKETEALSAALCASFIIASGFTKYVGRVLLDLGISDFLMPMLAGLLFVAPLLLSVYLLQLTPPPSEVDRQLRSAREAMTSADRRRFVQRFWPGLVLLILVYIAVTIARTIRDDFAAEIWRDMGLQNTPSVFATAETWVGISATAVCALTIWVKSNVLTLRITLSLMCAAFALAIVATWLHQSSRLPPYMFMVLCGIGLYFPYVAFHTTVFERLIAAARMPGNLGFLMYLADSIGYLGYATIIILRTQIAEHLPMLQFFRWSLFVTSFVAIVCLIGTGVYLRRKLAD